MKSFEDYLNDICPNQTNNSNEGFENWLADQDVSDIMEYAEIYGKIRYNTGWSEATKVATEAIRNLKF